MRKFRQKEYRKIGYYTFLYKRIGKKRSLVDESLIYSSTSEKIDISSAKLGEFAIFNAEMLGDFNAAERYFQKAVERDPNDSYWLGNYAIFLHYYKLDYSKAEKFYIRSLKIDIQDSFVLYNYAILLLFIKKDYNKAQKLLRKAIKYDKYQHKYVLTYAGFMFKIRKNFDFAEKLFVKLIKEHPQNAQILASYAQLKIYNDQFQEAEKLIDKAFELDPQEEVKLELWYYRYAHFNQWFAKAEYEIEHLLKNDVKCFAWGLQQNLIIALFKGHQDPDKLDFFTYKIVGVFKI